MEIIPTGLKGVLIIKPPAFEDERGYYVRSYVHYWLQTILKNYLLGQGFHNAPSEFVEHDMSMSRKGVLRGIHCASKRWRLCQCAYGSVHHVAVDLVADSATYGKWVSNVLSNENHLQILVPPMFGNSFQALSDHVIIHDMMTDYYDPEREKTYAWNDPKFSIPWPIMPPILSQWDSDAQWLEQ